MIDRVVCNKNAAPDHARHQRFITTVIDFLLGIQKAECAVVKLNGQEGESPSGLAESRRSLERKN